MRRSGLGVIAIALILVGGGIAVWSWSSTGSEKPTAASFGFQDWLVRCQTVKDNVGCGMSQQILDQKTGRAIVQLHLGRDVAGTGHQLVVVLPLGVTIADGASLEIGDFKRKIAFTQCLPGGCVGPTKADAALLDKLKAAGTAKLSVVDRAGNPVSVPFSLKGFSPAFDKMEAQGGIGGASWMDFWNSPAGN
jgi:invasion protein IalB